MKTRLKQVAVMRLSECVHPVLTVERFERLAGHQVERLDQLLTRPPEQLASILEISFTKVTGLLDDLTRAFCPFPESGLDIYQRQARWPHPLTTASTQIDELLCGGLRPGLVYSVYGEAGAGKTQLCLQLAVRAVASSTDARVFYIDTKNDFCAERLLEILTTAAGGGIEGPADLRQLARIQVARAFQADTLCDTLRSVLSLMNPELAPARLLIVDNLTSPLMPFVGTDEIHEAFALSSQIGQLVEQIAAKGATIFCVQQARTKDELLVPSLGKIWHNFGKVRLKLTRAVTSSTNISGEQLRRLSVERIVRSTHAQIGATCTLHICNAGLV